MLFFFFQAEDGIRDDLVTGVQTCALPILSSYTTQNLATEPEVTKAQIPGFYAGGGDAMHMKKNPWLFRIRPADGLQALALDKIGRASCRERVEISVVAGSVKRKRTDQRGT